LGEKGSQRLAQSIVVSFQALDLVIRASRNTWKLDCHHICGLWYVLPEEICCVQWA